MVLYRFNLATGGETRFVQGIWADGGFFEMLGVRAALGRTFSARDDVRGGGPDGAVAVVSYRYSQTAFGGADDVLGRSVQLNGVPFTIVGVMPPNFFGVEVGRSFDFIVPLRTEAMMRGEDSVLDSAASNFLSILARLHSGQSLDAAAAELRRVHAAHDRELAAVLDGADARTLGAWLRRLRSGPVGPYRLRRWKRDAGGALGSVYVTTDKHVVDVGADRGSS